MGWAKSYTMWCDRCDDLVNSADLGDQTLQQAKATARLNGAIIKNDGTVICQACRDEGER